MNPASTLEMLERSDADTILAGELVDREFASRALRLSLDGRRIFATMRAGDTAGAVVWLKKMGVDPYLIAHGLSIVHAQRLVRRLCPKCKTASSAEAGRLARLGIANQSLTLYKSVGCAECHQGFKGRVPIHETLVMNHDVQEMVLRDETAEEHLRNALRAGGGETLVEHGAELVKSGATTLEEVWAVLT
jgi:type II secretory ATPase GspE/PulE/Tfp pilus assembly ATPase PilB-like protein